jgi:hypothetical protein
MVTLIRFDNGGDKAREQLEVKVVRPSINNINYINNKRDIALSNSIKVEDRSDTENENTPIGKEDKVEPERRNPGEVGKKSSAKKESKLSLPTAEPDVIEFFREQKFPEIEAKKFFNYYQSVGWKVGKNKTMKNWQAAARNWMLHDRSYKKQNHDHYHTKTNKDYDQPL